MRRPHVVVFCTPEAGHFQLLIPVIRGLTSRGAAVRVYTARRFEASVREAGGDFEDLFGRYSPDSADDLSIPYPCRYVSFAGAYAGQVIDELRVSRPDLVIYETFSVIGRVVAKSMGIPAINVSPGHNLDPARLVPALRNHPKLRVSARCDGAVHALRSEYGVEDASPFSYLTGVSSSLNLYCEPPDFLDEAGRKTFEPVAFFGALDDCGARATGPAAAWRLLNSTRLRVYVSFGTVIWRYYRELALEALHSITTYFARSGKYEVWVSLGGAEVKTSALGNFPSDVRLFSYVDQRAVLAKTDLFVTHHGINSTHEALAGEVPMLSCPFFWDQPALAAKCQDMGYAAAISDDVGGPIAPDRIEAAILTLRGDPALGDRLAEAREAELRVVGEREAVFGQLLELASRG